MTSVTVPRKPGWYHTLSPGRASREFGFPGSPGDQFPFVAFDGSHWIFNLHVTGEWDRVTYSQQCACPFCPDQRTDWYEYCDDCRAKGHYLGVHLV